MFISNYNLLACKLLESYDFITSPQVVIIFGSRGLGKTEILKKISDKMRHANTATVLIDAEKFAAKYAFAAQTGQLKAFRREMRSCDLLLLDNINMLRGKDRSIEELFHTYESIIAKGGKTIVTFCSDCPSYEFLGERFASRLKCGLGIPLLEPSDKELKQFVSYYLKKKLPGEDITSKYELSTLPKNLHKIIERINRGSLNSLASEPENVKTSFIKRSMDYETRILISQVSEYFKLEESMLLGNGRSNTVVKGRYMLYLILHELYEYSFKDIAQYFLKDSSNLKRQSLIIKEKNKEEFERLCHKLYNQLTADNKAQ
ncbi:MAG: hypothetical protein APF84_17670 [Gracilibacter sp. BRH_c7a]|nr:MAG: hypothetical protein APF84_17670 [Gracilibacter sp. BRH_c7a]